VPIDILRVIGCEGKTWPALLGGGVGRAGMEAVAAMMMQGELLQLEFKSWRSIIENPFCQRGLSGFTYANLLSQVKSGGKKSWTGWLDGLFLWTLTIIIFDPDWNVSES